MTVRILSISLVLSLALVLGCNKDKVPCTNCPTSSGAGCEDIQNVKHFFYFKVGSWWVYEEESSGARDSVYVTSAVENPSNYDFDVEVYSTHQDYFYRFWPQYSPANNCNTNGVICNWCVSVKRSKYKPGEFIGEATCFIFIPSIGLNDYNPNNLFVNNLITIIDVFDSFNLNNLSFNRTIKLFENQTYMEGDQPTYHSFSENVGLTRKELLDSNQVWNLVDYHIEQ